MLWGDKQIGDFTKLVKPGYAHCALGPNEYVYYYLDFIFLFLYCYQT